MSIRPTPRGLWRRFTRALRAVPLGGWSPITVGLLVIPVSLQIFSRYTELIPSYIWTEEMARFLFIWTIMIGAMIGVREIDALRGRRLAAACAARRGGCCGCSAGSACWSSACVFVWCRHRVHALRLEPHLRARRPAALAASTSPGRSPASPGSCSSASRCSTTCEIISGRAYVTGAVLTPGMAALHPVRRASSCFMFLRVPVAFALGARLPADPRDRAAARHA